MGYGTWRFGRGCEIQGWTFGHLRKASKLAISAVTPEETLAANDLVDRSRHGLKQCRPQVTRSETKDVGADEGNQQEARAHLKIMQGEDVRLELSKHGFFF